MDLFNHWQSESIQSFGLLVSYINATDEPLERVSQPRQQCEQPETGSTAQGLSHPLLNLIAAEQPKPLIRAVGVCPGVSVHWPQMPESYQAVLAARLQPGQGSGTGSKAGHMAEST